jgi:hypothetical protein
MRVPHVEACSNTSTVTLRVVGGDEKETQCLGVELSCQDCAGEDQQQL